MTSTPRRIFPATLAVLAVSLAAGALSWACSPSAAISVSPGLGPAGSQITVSGANFVSPNGPVTVEVRWNGARGPVLATASGPAFTVGVTIPSASVDTHTIVAVGREPNGTVPGQASASFTIGTPRERSASDGSTSGAQSQARPGAGGTTSATTNGGELAGGGRTSGRAEAPAGQAGRSGTRSPSAGGVLTLRSGASVFADSVTASARAEAARGGGAAAKTSGSSKAAPSERSAAGDLWSGFAAGTAHAGLDSAVGRAEGPGSPSAFGMALLGLGLLTVVAGIGVAGARRRRMAVGPGGQASSD